MEENVYEYIKFGKAKLVREIIKEVSRSSSYNLEPDKATLLKLSIEALRKFYSGLVYSRIFWRAEDERHIKRMKELEEGTELNSWEVS